MSPTNKPVLNEKERSSKRRLDHQWRYQRLSLWQSRLKSAMTNSSFWRPFCFNGCQEGHHMVLSLCDSLDKLKVNCSSMLVLLAKPIPGNPALESYHDLVTGQSTYRWSPNFWSLMSIAVSLDYDNFCANQEENPVRGRKRISDVLAGGSWATTFSEACSPLI